VALLRAAAQPSPPQKDEINCSRSGKIGEELLVPTAPPQPLQRERHSPAAAAAAGLKLKTSPDGETDNLLISSIRSLNKMKKQFE